MIYMIFKNVINKIKKKKKINQYFINFNNPFVNNSYVGIKFLDGSYLSSEYLYYYYSIIIIIFIFNNTDL